MGWSIRPGSRAMVAASVTDPRRGEVWAYCTETGALSTHRCLGQAGGGRFRFQGDGAPRPDPPVPPERLIGRVIEVERHGRIKRLGLLDSSSAPLQRLLWGLEAHARIDTPASRRK